VAAPLLGEEREHAELAAPSQGVVFVQGGAFTNNNSTATIETYQHPWLTLDDLKPSYRLVIQPNTLPPQK
jgi:hypothetical protein